jgi:hypothetical protein
MHFKKFKNMLLDNHHCLCYRSQKEIIPKWFLFLFLLHLSIPPLI